MCSGKLISRKRKYKMVKKRCKEYIILLQEVNKFDFECVRATQLLFSFVNQNG